MPDPKVRGCDNLDVDTCIQIWPDIPTVTTDSIQVQWSLAEFRGTIFDADQELTIHRIEHPLQVGILPADVEVIYPNKGARSHQHMSAILVPGVQYIFELRYVQIAVFIDPFNF